MNKLGKNWLEWTVFGCSSLLVAALVGFLGWSAWTHTGEPAEVGTHIEDPVLVGKTWQVKVEVENRGDHACEGVEIEIEWEAQKQTARFILPELPRAGRRSGYAIFQTVGAKKLETRDLEARVVGYEEG